MRRRPSPFLSVGAALLVGLLATGCADDTEPTEPTDEPTTSGSPSASDTPIPDATETPVAGSGASIDPEDAEAWCGAVTPAQLAGATGVEVAAVESGGDGVQACGADVPDALRVIIWGSEPTRKTFDQYAASFERPAGVYEPSTITLDGGQPVVVAPRPGSPTAYAGTVVDGRLVQVVVNARVDLEEDSEELGEVARQILAVYVD